MKTITEAISKQSSNRRLADFLFILWAGGAALLSYSLVYTLRKPFTAATFDGIEAFGFDYKVLVTIIQIAGYLIAKFIGIKLISELKRENRLKFILVSIAVAELSLVAFGALPTPYNMFAMFFNGLSLGCMWGVIFSFIEGRRTTDILASLLGISIVISSGTAKSIGLFVMNTLNVSEFWMPALIGAFALPLLALLGYSLTRLPQPTAQDIEQKSSRVTLNGKQRKELFIDFMPFLVLLFVANLMLVVLRDIKEDFLVKIIDMNGQSSWMFAQVDTVVTLIILALFGAMAFVKSNIKVLVALLGLVVLGTATMSFISFNYDSLQLDAITMHKEDELLLDKIIKFIEDNIDDESMNPDSLADFIGVSKAGLYRKLKELTEKTPSEFVRTIRLEYAAGLLKTTKLTVTEIMYKSGFSNKSYFYREFAKLYNTSPKEYRSGQTEEKDT